MNILFLCLGTRGDVQPYVAIGKTAKEFGHKVTICTGRSFENFVRINGLEFTECSLDLLAILQTPEGKQVFEDGMKHPVKAMQYARKVINPLYRKAMTEFYEACQTNDVIIYHPKAFGAVDIAEKLGILCISMPPVPIIYPITEFPNLAISTKNLGGTINKLTYQLTNSGAESNNIKDINEFREKVLHLGRRKSGEYMIKRNGYPLPIIYPISPSLFTDIKEFREKVYLSGFPVLEDGGTLDEETEEFLKYGKQPIIVTFSSMPLKDSQSFMKKVVASLSESGNRGIIITGNSGIKMSSSESLMIKEFLPHDAVFKRAKGILHHGGVGTMAAALRSGRPQVIMPFNVDQPFWAKRLYNLGYSLKPLKESDSEKEFVNRFIAMDNKDIILQSEKIAAIINQEKANEKAVGYIEQQYREWYKHNE
ncbi:glycosyltransferase [Anaerocolumna sp. MB42-C2]|uniref:glycosyltransferase n=1 Tax=Anaerocolumna sp. MB42-C2 TaxID=3070997 RepID=UPI0027E084F8|nr:glycosyltransferase [Anaerocolumna sp. MB42-C2]WMJ86963.1 glycosyltransferase [Anaerocolumna sp. MB42-C2]